jgi:alginate O-acetyltransferase complex protein AlgI
MFIFLPVTLAVYYIVPFRAKNPVLLLCSLIFYAWGEPVYVFLMILNIAFNYVMGLDIEMNADNPVRKRISLILCMIFNLGLLGFFKYFGFVMENIDALPGVNIPYHEVGLPIGISFYTFQVMSYIIDVYKGKISAQKNPLTLGVYVTMFPQLIAGPIVQYSDVERQLAERVISLERFGEGTRIFIIGLAKKVLLANSAGSVFKSLSDIPYSELSVLSAWILAIAFTFQIYFDFSGYSDMAVGLGKMLGFDFKPNFDYPYMSESATEFWRRWHISLGSWFRDYVYIPLGGSYVSAWKHIRNILTVWLLTGLWHGASWNFIVWGLYYGVILIFEKYFLLKHRNPVKHIYTMLVVIVGWVIFSAPDIHTAGGIIAVMFDLGEHPLFDDTGIYYLTANAVIGVIMIFASTPYISRVASKWGKTSTAALLIMLLISIAYLVNDTYNPFLYFRF